MNAFYRLLSSVSCITDFGKHNTTPISDISDMNYLFLSTNCVFQSCNAVYHGFQEASKSSNVIFLNGFYNPTLSY